MMNSKEYGLFMQQVLIDADKQCLTCRGRPLWELWDVSILIIKLVDRCLSDGWSKFCQLATPLETPMYDNYYLCNASFFQQTIFRYCAFLGAKKDIVLFLYNNKSFLLHLRRLGDETHKDYIMGSENELLKRVIINKLININ